MNKKHQRDWDIRAEGDNDDNTNEGTIQLNSDEMDCVPEEVVNVEFIFSCMSDDYFLNIKHLIRPLFQFDNVNLTGVTDLILRMKEDVGITIKTDQDDDSIHAIFTLIPFKPFKDNISVQQLTAFIKEKASIAQHKSILSLLNNQHNSFGLLISERLINLPHELIPPALKLLIKEIGECEEEEGYDARFDVDYIIMMTKIAKKQKKSNNTNSQKKKKTNTNTYANVPEDTILYYKQEMILFEQFAYGSFNYKIPYIENHLKNLENSDEPQYISILFIKRNEFFTIINSL